MSFSRKLVLVSVSLGALVLLPSACHPAHAADAARAMTPTIDVEVEDRAADKSTHVMRFSLSVIDCQFAPPCSHPICRVMQPEGRVERPPGMMPRIEGGVDRQIPFSRRMRPEEFCRVMQPPSRTPLSLEAFGGVLPISVDVAVAREASARARVASDRRRRASA